MTNAYSVLIVYSLQQQTAPSFLCSVGCEVTQLRIRFLAFSALVRAATLACIASK